MIRRWLLAFALLLPGLAAAQIQLVNCAPSVPCTTAGPSQTGDGDVANLAFGKLNFDVALLNSLIGGSGLNNVGISAPAGFTVSSTPCTTSGCVMALGYAPGQSASQFLGTPDGVTGPLGLRSLSLASLPAAIPNANLAPMVTDTVKCNPFSTTQISTDCVASQVNALTGFNAITVLPSGDATGATDCTNLAAAFSTMSGASATSSVNHALVLYGNYTINCKLIMTLPASNAVPFWISGSALITQATANTGIFEFQVPTGGFPVGPRIDGISFTWSSSQPATATAAVAVGFRSVNSTGTGSETVSNIIVRNSNFSNGYTFWGNTQPAGSFSMWNLTVDKVNANVYSGPVLWFASPVTIGNPNIHVELLTTAQPTSDNVSPIIYVSGCDNLLIENTEFLQHINNNPVIRLNSVSAVNILSSKCEACTFGPQVSGPFTNKVIQFQNSYGFIGPFTLNGDTFSSGSGVAPVFASIENGSANQSVTMVAPVITNPAGSGTITLFGTGGMRLNVIGAPNVNNTGTVTVRLTNSGSTTNAADLSFATPPAGTMPAADQGDASFTLSNPLATPEVLIWNTPLTANRTVTLSASHGSAVADNLWDGASYRILRTSNATGAFTLTVTGTSIPTSLVVPIGGYAEFKYSYALGWVEVDAGSL